MEKNPSKLNMSDVISKASKVINEQKMERHAFQVGFLINRILPLYEEDKANEIVIADLDKLIFVSADISKRLKDSRYSDAADLCSSMTDLIRRVRKTHPKPRAKDLELMPELSQAIQLAFEGGEDPSSSVSKIVDSLRNQNKISTPAQ
jgi:hypothetical protein